MNLFYKPNITPNDFFPEEESAHIVRVLRLATGAEITLTDGKGGLYKAIITDASPKRCAFEVKGVQKAYEQRPYYIHIAIAPTKNIDRIEWFIEKAVEAGIDEITFLETARTERKHIKLERLEKIAVSAMKQSLKAYLPKLNASQDLKQFLDHNQQNQRFIAHLDEGQRLTLKTEAKVGGDYCVLIGPEGDFTPAEIKHALNVGFVPVSLGPSRLRTETAGLAACFMLNFIND